MDRRIVYMDYNATTPLHPDVKAQMIADMEIFANASSLHEAGRTAHSRVEQARASVARLIGAKHSRVEQARASVARLIGAKDPNTVIFTSGGSESNNTVFATMFHLGRKGPRKGIITTAIEHPCVINSAKWLEEEGFPVRFLGVDPSGRIDLEELRAACGPETLLVSVMAANNEIGTIEDVAAAAEIAHRAGAFFHTDATQCAGKIPVDVEAWKADYLTLSCHKIYGPKGIGALYIRKGAPIVPLIRGGHQEHGHRAGTYNNPGILGFGIAADIAFKELPAYSARVRKLRNRLRDGLVARIPKIRVNGHETEVLPNTLNISFPGAEGESILLYLDLEGIQVSTGSACASGSLEPSHVLMATGLGAEMAHGSIRFSLGRGTTEEDVDYVIEKLPPIIERLRRMSTMN
jgi:cysteine desulfurase